MAAPTETSLDQLCVDTIRTLSMDAVQAANSGHPGMPMAMAPAAYVLFAKVMQHDPQDPDWPDRDRFVLSAGHGSMLLYSVLHLSGYSVSLDDLKAFRQWGSLTPGHPERDRTHVTPGVEVTTGPLGQGFANGVGMAMAERFLRERFGEEVMSHFTYAICSDGDLMEGIASEAASLAGHLGLGRLVYLYDDNDISLDGPTSLSFGTEDVTKRFEAYGWHVLEVHDANDLTALEAAIEAGRRETDRPTLIRVKSIIGYPSPSKQGTSKAHGSPLGEDEVRATKEALGWDPDAHFLVPDGVYDAFSQADRGAEAHAAWKRRFEEWKGSAGDLAQEWELAWEGGSYGGRPLPGLREALGKGKVDWGKEKLATRAAGQKVMAAFSPFVPTMVGGAADLSESTKTEFPGGDDERYTKAKAGRNVFWGVREHGMGGAVNGLAAHGGIVRPYGSTFLQFADYMRGSIRLGSLTGLRTAWVFTHDSVALGEDGPTHQPVEHLAALRAIPGLVVLRPADAEETAAAWRVVLEDLQGPACFALSRQDLPILAEADHDGVAKGAYVLRPADGEEQAAIVGTGAEVHTALAAADLLAGEGIAVRVVSMPSWELFAQQDDAYQDEVLPPALPKVSVEAGISMGWERWVDRSVAIDRFGASAPGTEVLERLGITPEATAAAVKELLGA
ncbi:transketolase [Conexibacter sp. SYSU D00693]|uniref:transketolase n=1 Tax=Conexibacter sp. SYSU D00693 TaxID=2812560 RepID=UPI00196A54D5|nr:transketolase [Conexibacter sp. SYSU D00693]